MRAVIDVGSNSVLLLVAEFQDGAWRPVREWTSVTGLGRGTKSTGLLSQEGMSDTLAAVRRAWEMAEEHGADRILAAATMAARIAKNTAEFQEAGKAQGTPIEILSGEEEAELGFLAVADDPLFAEESRITIIDPGGNSTELVTAQREEDGWKTLFRRSFPIGALGLRDTAFQTETPGFRERLAALDEIDSLIAMEYLPGQCGRVATLGATGTNLVMIREAMTAWDAEFVHGAELDFEEVSKAVGWLCGLTDAGRAAVPGLEPGRERTIHGGALILERFLQAVHALSCTVSVRGWRHALLERLERRG